MGRAVLILDKLPDPVGVIAFVGDDVGSRRQVLQEKFSHRLIVHLPGRQLDLNRQAIADNPEV